MVIGSIFTDEFLQVLARGDTIDVPLATIIPLLAMENLQLRARIQNLQETLKQEQFMQALEHQVYKDDE